MLAIIHAELIMRNHLIPDGVLFIDEGKIFGIATQNLSHISSKQ